MKHLKSIDFTQEDFEDKELKNRFYSHIKKDGDNCWIWIGSRLPISRGKNLHTPGYGQFGFKGKTTLSHRLAYLFEHGSIPENLIISHTCDNPGCCNPNHLIATTQCSNIRDRDEKGRGDWTNPPRGERNGNSKLTSEDVEIIRKIGKSLTQVEISKKFNISQSAICRILNNKIWI